MMRLTHRYPSGPRPPRSALNLTPTLRKTPASQTSNVHGRVLHLLTVAYQMWLPICTTRSIGTFLVSDKAMRSPSSSTRCTAARTWYPCSERIKHCDISTTTRLLQLFYRGRAVQEKTVSPAWSHAERSGHAPAHPPSATYRGRGYPVLGCPRAPA